MEGGGGGYTLEFGFLLYFLGLDVVGDWFLSWRV